LSAIIPTGCLLQERLVVWKHGVDTVRLLENGNCARRPGPLVVETISYLFPMAEDGTDPVRTKTPLSGFLLGVAAVFWVRGHQFSNAAFTNNVP